MLVLTRKPNQSIMVGDETEITVIEVTGNQVRLGITAPKEIPIYRRELAAKWDGGLFRVPPPAPPPFRKLEET